MTAGANSLLDVLPIFVVLLDPSGTVIDVNRPALEGTGTERLDVVGRKLWECPWWHKSDIRDKIRSAFGQAIRGDSKRYRVHARAQSGLRLPLDCVLRPLTGEDGRIHAVVASAIDLTDRQSTEMALRESRESYRTLFESIREGFCVIEVLFDENDDAYDYRFVEINPAFEEQTGLKGAAGRTIRELVPSFEQSWVSLYGRVVRTGRPVSYTNESASMNRWFDVEAFPIGEPGGNRVAVLFSDITDRRLAEAERDEVLKALHAERSQLLTLFVEAPAAIAVLRGPDHVFELVNPLYQQLVGHRELIGKSVREALPEVESQGYFELLDQVFETGESHTGTGVLVRLQPEPGGPLLDRYVDFVYQPLRDSSGAVTGVFAHAVDVTEHRHAVDALARAHGEMERKVDERTADLRAVNAELEAFNYSVSHDLRAPLRGIDGFSTLLMEDFGDRLGPEGQRFLTRIRENTRRMGTLIDDLLKLSRLTGQGLTRQEVDLSSVARSVLEMIQERQPERSVTVLIHPDMRVSGDEGLLRTVMENLLENAWKFTSDREVARIEVGREVIEGTETFFVADNGAGFDMRFADKLFVAFQRLHDPTKYGGTGIGLAIVERIIDKHGGRIWADSEVDKGATFRFTLTS